MLLFNEFALKVDRPENFSQFDQDLNIGHRKQCSKLTD